MVKPGTSELIEGQLESALSEPFAANYKELLAEARKGVEAEPVAGKASPTGNSSAN